MRVVLDTAVLITGLRSPNGAAAEVLTLILHQEITLLMDYKIACEYREVAMRPTHLRADGLSIRETEQFIRVLENLAEPVFVRTQYRPMSSDPDDDMVLDIAINGHANAIISNNVKHLKRPAAEFGVEVLTPGELLGSLGQES